MGEVNTEMIDAKEMLHNIEVAIHVYHDVTKSSRRAGVITMNAKDVLKLWRYNNQNLLPISTIEEAQILDLNATHIRLTIKGLMVLRTYDLPEHHFYIS